MFKHQLREASHRLFPILNAAEIHYVTAVIINGWIKHAFLYVTCLLAANYNTFNFIFADKLHNKCILCNIRIFTFFNSRVKMNNIFKKVHEGSLLIIVIYILPYPGCSYPSLSEQMINESMISEPIISIIEWSLFKLNRSPFICTVIFRSRRTVSKLSNKSNDSPNCQNDSN